MRSLRALLAATALLALAATGGAGALANGAVQLGLAAPNTPSVPLGATPATLGLLLPNVPGYLCTGFYTPAQKTKVKLTPFTPPPTQLGMPFWTLTVTCFNPHLRYPPPDTQKSLARPGAVFAFENPVPLGQGLPRATAHVGDARRLRYVSLGPLRVWEGTVGFSGAPSNALQFVQGQTSWLGDGAWRTGSVQVLLTGHNVPMSVLVEFAKDMHPVSYGL